jgi:hypothetical protein
MWRTWAETIAPTKVQSWDVRVDEPLVDRFGAGGGVGSFSFCRATDRPVRSWEGVVALNARDREICGALSFYAQRFLKSRSIR